VPTPEEFQELTISGEIRIAPISAPNQGLPPHFLLDVYPAKIGKALKVIPPIMLKNQ
jgi:hypothetical protein